MVSVLANDHEVHLDQLLKVYYRKLFPCDLFCQWLSYGSKNTADILSRREFSFSLAGDVYIRYQSFNDSNSLRKELIKVCPHKIDIGAVYSASPKLQRSLSSASFKPEWKELVFDIDLTDYDDIRFCCGAQNGSNSAALCPRCWHLAKCAVLCLDRALRKDFGFENLLWVFSGRRGVHCWVCDPVARQLDSTNRTAVAEYLSLVRGNESKKLYKSSAKNTSAIEPLLHPSIDAAVDILKPRFSDFVSDSNGQALLSHPDRIKWMLSFFPTDMEAERNSLQEMWSNESDSIASRSSDVSVKRWNTLQSFLTERGRSNVLKAIIINATYPRLDINVTTGVNHLLKSPFVAHPKTGYICVPFDPRKIDEFDPNRVPKLSELVEQLGQLGGSAAAGDDVAERHLLAYKHTGLRSAIEIFESFVNRISSSARDTHFENEIAAGLFEPISVQ